MNIQYLLINMLTQNFTYFLKLINYFVLIKKLSFHDIFHHCMYICAIQRSF